MKTVEFLNGWEKNFVTIFLEHNLFKNEKDEINKLTKIFTFFIPFCAKFKFNTKENDEFFEKLLATNNYDTKVIYIGKKLFSKNQYKLIEVCTNELLSYNLIKLAIQHKVTLDFELWFNDQLKVTGVLYGDAGESHSIHFNKKCFDVDKIKSEIISIFKT